MSEQAIVTFLRDNGPSTPAKVAKHLGVSLLFASAMLGEVASKGSAKMSHLKIGGGSPLYYLKDQRDLLQNFVHQLNPKDKEAYQLLQNKKVLRDKDQSPLVRVSLRSIKDFAVQLTIVTKESKETFWKWYLLSDLEAQDEIRKILNPAGAAAPKSPERKVEKKVEPAKPVQKETIKEKVSEKAKVITEKIKEAIPKTTPKKTIQQTIPSVRSDFGDTETSAFAKKVQKYFDSKGISVVSYEVIKKNKEFTFTLSVPSAVGSTQFYAKALDKKKVNEGDLAIVLIEGQYKKMPALFLSNGEGTKKVQEKMDNLFKDLSFVKV